MDPVQIDEAIFFLGQVGAAIIAIFGAGAVLYNLIFKKVWGQLETINKELHPNGGTSLRDAVNRIENNQIELKNETKEIRNKIDDHIEWHLDN